MFHCHYAKQTALLLASGNSMLRTQYAKVTLSQALCYSTYLIFLSYFISFLNGSVAVDKF